MSSPERVVFDCNVYFQAFLSATGPAGQLLSAVSDKTLSLFLSEFVLDELKDVLSRPHLVAKFKFTSTRVAEYLHSLVEMATLVTDVPHVFEFPRDPNDAHYVDLAIATGATLIVSRDKDLLSLRDLSTPDAKQLFLRFPALTILTPTEALLRIAK